MRLWRRSVRSAGPNVIQLWPEHFDAGCDVTSRAERKATIGASTGDQHFPTPYLYVLPWDTDRPGDPQYWNALLWRGTDLRRSAGSDDA